jgi:protein involved in polysaccharide export with SLBB domain
MRTSQHLTSVGRDAFHPRPNYPHPVGRPLPLQLLIVIVILIVILLPSPLSAAELQTESSQPLPRGSMRLSEGASQNPGEPAAATPDRTLEDIIARVAAARAAAAKARLSNSPAATPPVSTPGAASSAAAVPSAAVRPLPSNTTPSRHEGASPLPPSPSPAALSPVTMGTLDDQHKLAVGDKLSFRIVEDEQDPSEPREPKPLVVTDSGELEIPYIGRFPAEGKTCKQLASELKTALEKDYYQRATVILAIDLMARSRGKVYLVGPVRVPGPQEIPSDEVLTLGKAITRAGGFTDFADKRNVKVIRKTSAGEQKTLVVDVGEILDKGKVERDIPLETGDLILVHERAIRF